MRGGAAVAAEVAVLPLEELVACVRALPRAVLVAFCALGGDCLGEERAASTTPPPVVLATAADMDEILTAEEAAAVLRTSVDGVYARVARGELVALPRCRGGRLKFRRGDLHAAIAGRVDQRYSPPHDTLGRAKPPEATRLDATPACGGPQRNGHDRRPLGARRASRNTARRHEPWAPGQGAWADPQGDPRPKGGGA